MKYYSTDEKFILGIAGFISDAQKEENPPDAWQLLATIAHDIGEWKHNRGKEWFSPRTKRFQPKEFFRYRIWTYDLISDEEGLSVNDRYKGGIVEIPSKLVTEGKDEELIKFLKQHGPIFQVARNKLFTIEGEAEYTLYFTYNGIPAFEIVREEE